MCEPHAHVPVEWRRQDDDLSSLSGGADGREVNSMVRAHLLMVSADRSAHRLLGLSVELVLKARFDGRREALQGDSQQHCGATRPRIEPRHTHTEPAKASSS